MFENAYFGKKFLGRENRKGEQNIIIYAFYDSINRKHYCISSNYIGKELIPYNSDGTCSQNNQYSFYHDIVSEWHEEIDEEELENLASTEYGMDALKYAYKAGYRKAKDL